MEESANLFEGDWLVIWPASGGALIGKKVAESGNFYVLSPAFEYVSLLQQVQLPDGQGVGFGRVRAYNAFDDNLNPIKLHVHVLGAKVLFFSELEGRDLAKYKSGVIDAMQRVTEMRAQESGITLPNESNVRGVGTLLHRGFAGGGGFAR